MLQENKRPKIFWWIVTAFLLVPLIVSVVSTIHVINFFELSNHSALALTLAIAFEIGALSALAGLIALDKINKNIVWLIFFILTAYQMMGNTFFAFDYISKKMITNPDLIKNWTELFGFSTETEDLIFVKRIIAIISGAILPIVSLSFLDLSVDYIQKSTGIQLNRPIGNNKPIEQKNEGPIVQSEIEIQPSIEDNIETPIELSESEDNDAMLLHEDDDIDNLVEDLDDDKLEKLVEQKKQKLEKLKNPYLELLLILYKGGELHEGSELPSYPDFVNMLPPNKYVESTLKSFLTFCNYLEIFKISGTQKIALKSYAEAIDSLNKYFKWN